MRLNRLAICFALVASLAAHAAGFIFLLDTSVTHDDERASGSLSPVIMSMSPADFFSTASMVEQPVDDSNAAEPVDATQPLTDASAKPVTTNSVVPVTKPVETAKTVSAVKTASISPVQPVTKTLKPKEDKRSRTEVRKRQKKAKKTQRKRKATASIQSSAASSRRGSARSRVGDGGRSRKAAGRANLSSYLGQVISKVRRQKRYPAAARRARAGGTAVVAFAINKQGRVSGVRLKRRSGNASIDREVLAMVRRAAPFPPIPRNIGRSRLSLSLPVRFSIR